MRDPLSADFEDIKNFAATRGYSGPGRCSMNIGRYSCRDRVVWRGSIQQDTVSQQ